MKIAVEPPQTKPPSFSSLPDDILVSCLARIPRSYYPKLSLVSKTFCSLILSDELFNARIDFKTYEYILFVCLQLPDRPRPSWFSLWIKPDQTLTNDLDVNNKSSGNSLLVPIPSSYYPHVPTIFNDLVGSKNYEISQSIDDQTSSLHMWVCNEGTSNAWHKAPRMKVVRENDAVAGVMDGKIYVMGGCDRDESTNWAEVFDTKTQTWESLSDPGLKLRFSLIKEMEVNQGKVYVRSSADYDYVYDPKENRWDVIAKAKFWVNRWCELKKLWYGCDKNYCYWYDTKHNIWRVVKGLEVFIRNCCGGIITLAINSGKLLILWDKFDDSQNKNIWCSVIALEKRDNNDEVLGEVERTNVVLTVPSSYVFLRSNVEGV